LGSSKILTNPSPIQATNSLAIPAPNRQPTFDEIAGIAVASAILCGQSVCVLCLTHEILQGWIHQLEEFSAPVTLLDVLNTNRATLADWKALLSSQSYDVTILYGAQSELRTNRLSVGYVKVLVDAAPSGLVVIA
jgi:hypothetical protein